MGLRGLRITRPLRDQTDNPVENITSANNTRTTAMETHSKMMDVGEVLQKASALRLPGGIYLVSNMNGS